MKIEGIAFTNSQVERTASGIIKKVECEGDKALCYFAKKFDRVELKALKVPGKKLKSAFEKLPKEEKKALKAAGKNIEFFARKQMPGAWKAKKNGFTAGEILRPIETVGVYVPAGKFPLVSSVLMNCIPAKIAGVKRIIVCTPPKADKKILAACWLLGIKEVFLAGGAQAIAAMAFGTESIPKVCKIVGPGNAFVMEAKRQLYGKVDIDMPAGPSEVLVYSNKGKAGWITAELLAQAEHDESAKSVFLTTNAKLAAIIKSAAKGKKNIETITLPSERQAIDFINAMAPEHLVLFDGAGLLPRIRNAGSIFVGKYSAVAFGDYCSGSNHVLPTGGFAKARGGLSVRDFVKAIAVQEVAESGAKKLAAIGETIAEMEGLKEHKKSMELRRKV